MAKPTLTDAQRAAVQSASTSQAAKATALTSAVSGQDAVIAAAQNVDDAFKGLFGWYNDSIIAKYDAERKALDGVYIAAPITEADVVAVGATPPTGRLVPTYPALDILRVTQFDGGGTTTTALNEIQAIADQVLPEGYLVSGFGGTSPTGITVTSLTDSALTPSSTTLNVKDASNPLTFAVGNIFNVEDGLSSAVILVNSVTIVHGTAPYQYTLGITQLVSGTVNTAGAIHTGWTGFTNSERTAKTATVLPAYQNIMNGLIAQLHAPIAARQARLAEQLAALAANDDPTPGTELSTAITNCNTAASFLTAYLISTDISNTGLASLATERGVRGAQITARIALIIAAYTGRATNYYNARYDVANNRGHLQRGSAREVSNAQNAKAFLQSMTSGLGDSVAALNGLL